MTDSAKRRAPILAAGGIVLRGKVRPRFAVVRLRREKAWVLPKGKLYPREHPRDAAKREVLEETGHDVTVHEFLGSVSYVVEGKLKIVQFWLMRAAGAPVHELNDDVKAEVAAVAASHRHADPPARKSVPHPCRADCAAGSEETPPLEIAASGRHCRQTPRPGRCPGRARHRVRLRKDPAQRRQGAEQLGRPRHASGGAQGGLITRPRR